MKFPKDNFIFYQKVKDPSDFGILEFDNSGELIKLIEKPTKFISNFVAVGVYIFDSQFSNYYSSLKKSKRELNFKSKYNLKDYIENFINQNKK